MTLQLTGKNEQEGLYKAFTGFYFEQMPLLFSENYLPLSIAQVIERRLSAPKEVLAVWRQHPFLTVDGLAWDEQQKSAKIVLDANLLRIINNDGIIDQGALILPREYWAELQGDKILTLSAAELEQSHNQGYIYKNGIWQPANGIVGKIWEHLEPGIYLREYAELAGKRSGSGQVMQIRFKKNHGQSRSTNFNLPAIQELALSGLVNNSSMESKGLDCHFGNLVGVAQREARPSGEKVADFAPTEIESNYAYCAKDSSQNEIK